MTVKTVIEKTCICDICKKEVEDFALPFQRESAIRKIEKLTRNEIIDIVDVCQDCSDRLLMYMNLIRHESR